MLHLDSVLHLDSAAGARTSAATRAAMAAHVEQEAESGVYVAEAAARPRLARLRADLAGIVGMPADGIAFVESATAALKALLDAWPVSEVAVLPSEWGTNLSILTDRGVRLVRLGADEAGVLDLDGFARLLATSPPSAVHLTQVAAHRGLLQPVAAAAALCRGAGVPLWVDAAQSLGHVDVAQGADVVYGTSRKWLRGPRGVGLLAVAEAWWPTLHVRHHVLADPDEPTVRGLESDDAHVAGRIGLANAVTEYLAAGPEQVWGRLADVGSRTREALADLPGWALVDGPGTAITALRPTAGQEVGEVRARLLSEHRVLTTASYPARAPGEMTAPTLRLSPHTDCSDAVLDAVRAALSDL